MTASFSKYASSLILFEWGVIMVYFELSGRVSAFLHPNFRPLLWIAGLMLVLTAGALPSRKRRDVVRNMRKKPFIIIPMATRQMTWNTRITALGQKKAARLARLSWLSSSYVFQSR